MIVAIHQPNYLPWSGFFHKMALCDQFVFLVNVPFSKNSYQNRTRIKINREARWLTVPVMTANHFGQLTNVVKIAAAPGWAKKHWRTLEQSYRDAPHFGWLTAGIGVVYESDWEYLADVSIELISRVGQILGIKTPLIRASSLRVEGTRSELLASVCQQLGASQYLSGPSGRNYLDLRQFANRDIRVSYHRFSPPVYAQLHGEFVPALSVIDLLANVGPQSWSILESSGRCSLE